MDVPAPTGSNKTAIQKSNNARDLWATCQAEIGREIGMQR
jgi:hypothetical protein